tara:strand:- start:471 stop:668 length:198 start_codon:yes stop_codon:yes gene_type:complete
MTGLATQIGLFAIATPDQTGTIRPAMGNESGPSGGRQTHLFLSSNVLNEPNEYNPTQTRHAHGAV